MEVQPKTKDRIISIDIMKLFAVLLVLNSHMEKCYHPYEILATGGAIGDALFFFCSGFMLFMGPTLRFDNFMKKRISRIYPSVIVVSIIGCLFFNQNNDIISIIIDGGGWCVKCIIIYYILIWGIKKWLINHINIAWTFSIIIVLLWYYAFFDNEGQVSLYGNNYFKWVFFFLFMLQGAVMGSKFHNYKYNKWVLIKLTLCLIAFYSFHILQNNLSWIVDLQYLSIIPLMGIIYYAYLFCCASFWRKIYENKIAGQAIFILGGLCLDCYLVQYFSLTDKLNWLFPLNIPLIMAFILCVSYIVNFTAALFSQTFQKRDYDYLECLLWKR